VRAERAVAEMSGPTEATEAIRAAISPGVRWTGATVGATSRRKPPRAAAGGDGDAGVAEAGDVAFDGADVDPQGGGQVLGGGVAAGGQAQLLDQAVLAFDPEPGQVGLGRCHRSSRRRTSPTFLERPTQACRTLIVGSGHGHDTARDRRLPRPLRRRPGRRGPPGDRGLLCGPCPGRRGRRHHPGRGGGQVEAAFAGAAEPTGPRGWSGSGPSCGPSSRSPPT
jgi:hypothetical protein